MQNVKLYLGLLTVSGVSIWAASFVPALTTSGNVNNGVEDQEAFVSAVGREFDHCRESADDIDCRCFANVAGVVIASERPRVPGARYPDRVDLARSQAEERC